MITSIKHMVRCFSALSVAAALVLLTPTSGLLAQTQSGAEFMTPGIGRLSVEVNKGTLIRLNVPATEIFIANPEIADVQVKSSRVVYVFGKLQGETTLYALDKDDNTIFSSTVQVTRNLSALSHAYEQLLPGVQVEAKAIGQLIVLQGNVASPAEAATAEQLARRVLATDAVMNNLNIIQPTQVNLRVRIAEVARSVIKQLGVNWQGFKSGSSFGFGLATGREVMSIVEDPAGNLVKQFSRASEGGSIFGDIITGGLDLNYAIDALDQEGFIKVLAEPNLTALTGQEANFLAGGEYPIPVPSRDGIGIQYREFGVKLDFTPTVMSSGRISMHVRPEVSDLSTAGSIVIEGMSIPSISTRRAETTVELGSGQSFAIAGLIENSITQSSDKFPFLGDIPILGALFKSESFRREETELLIVVTPYLVRPVSDRQIMMPTDNYKAPTDFDRIVMGKRWEPTSANPANQTDQFSGPSLKNRAGFQLD